MPRRANDKVRTDAAATRRRQCHRRVCDPARAKAAGLQVRTQQQRYRLLTAGATPTLEPGMLALVSYQGRVRPVAVAAADADSYSVVLLSARIPEFRWDELTGIAPMLARRTMMIPNSVQVSRSSALLVLGWLSGVDQDRIALVVETRDLPGEVTQ